MALASRGRGLALLGLALAAGGVDAASYLGLGHAFPANMTGNTVLLGVAVARGDGTAGLRSALALGGFSLGVVIGALLVTERGRWPGGSALALAVEALVMLTLLVGWLATGASSPAARYVLLGLAGHAMGLQSVAARSASDGDVATTYVTGTLTKALTTLTRRVVHPGAAGAREADSGDLAGAVWLAYGVGALAGALIEVAGQGVALIMPAGIVSLTAAAALAVKSSAGRQAANSQLETPPPPG